MVKFLPRNGMFKRNITETLKEALDRSPVVLLTGPRQSGKTTLMKEIGKEKNYHYVSFDDIRYLSAAQLDPIGFIEKLKKPVILDEVQRVPEIFLTIKKDVDENRIPGRYALTGSANPLLIPQLGDSLAGRMEILQLFPLSQGELLNKKDEFIDHVFNNEQPAPSSILNVDELYEKITIGGYPSVQTMNAASRESWFNSYITTLLQRDIKEISQITGLTDFPLLLNILAVRAGNLLNVAELSRVSGIPSTTLHRYLILLDTLFLTYLQPPWSTNIEKRFVKTPKVYLTDTGVLSFLLGTHVMRTSLEGRNLGPIVENFVAAELKKQATWNRTRVRPFHFRTSTGIEVDIVLQNAAGNLVGIEVKNNRTVTAQDFKGLKQLQEISKTKFIQGIVLYTGSEIIPFGQRLFALPINSLWTSNFF